MATKASVGHSVLVDSRAAGQAAAQAAAVELGGMAADLCLVFATANYDQEELLAGIRATIDPQPCGCTGEKIIASSIDQESSRMVAVMLAGSTSLRFEPLLVKDYGGDSASCGAELAQAVAGAPDALALLVMPDGLTGNCTEFLETLQESLALPLLVAGGTSADDFQFGHTYQYGQDGGRWSHTGALSACLIRGRGHMDVAVSHGCLPIGLERTITRASGGWVQEIDGRPAWDIFKEYLDGDPDDLNAEGIVHLCIGKRLEPKASDDYDPFVIRTPLRLDKETGALFFPSGGVPQGQRIQLTRRDPARVHESARACAESIHRRNPGREPALVIQFDCAGRGELLFGADASRHTVTPLREVLGTHLPWIGLRTYGEIAPILGRSFYHNYSVALCALYDGES